MNLPDGYSLIRVVSPGPAVVVALARDASGAARIVKGIAGRRDDAADADAIAWEARVLRALEAAGVAGVPRVVGEWEGAIAMEDLAMPTLGEREAAMRDDRAFRERAMRATFERLDAIHAAGVVHGDVSPGNVFVSDDGRHAAMADFGLARLADETTTRGAITRGRTADDGAFRGTLLYAAPEVARSEPFDARADDFALAASLLHMATGVPLRALAHDGASPASVLVNAGSRGLDASHPWRALAYERFPRSMADALFRSLADDPRDRRLALPRAW